MEVTDGNLSWAATLDINGITNAKDKLIKYFKDMGLSAEDAGKRADEAMKGISDAISEATGDVKSQAEAVEVLKAAYEEMQKQIDGMEGGEAKEVLQGIAEGFADVIDEMEDVSQQGNPLKNIGVGADSARQQLREMTEELVNMKLRGEENTEAYQQLLEKVGMLKDAMADTQQAVKGMASDTATLDSVLGAAQLTAGGFSAIIGAMNLVGAGEDTKELAEAQKKLQAAIAVTTGLQGVQNALQKQSALMLGIQKIQLLAAAKAESIKNAATGKGIIATKAATVAQAAFNAVANANPYVLLATALITVVGALVAFSKGSKEAKKREEELARETERVNEKFDNLKSTVGASVGKVTANFKALQLQWSKLKTAAEQKKWIDDNVEAFRKLGVKVNDVNDAQKIFVEMAPQVLGALQAQARANGLLDLYQEYENAIIKAQIEVDRLVAQSKLSVKAGDTKTGRVMPAEWAQAGISEYAGDVTTQSTNGYDGGSTRWTLTQKGAEKYYAWVREQNQHLIDEARQDAQYVSDEWTQAIVDAEAASKAVQDLLTNPGSGNNGNPQSEVESIIEGSLKYWQQRVTEIRNQLNNMRPDDENFRPLVNALYEAQMKVEEIQQLMTTTPPLELVPPETGVTLKEAEETVGRIRTLLNDTDPNTEQFEIYIQALRDWQKKAEEIKGKIEAETQQETLDKLLAQYQTHEERKKTIIKKFQKDIEELERQRDNASSIEERLRIEQAIAEAQRQQSEELEVLEVEYGRMARLEARRAQLERQILLAWNSGDKKRLEELRKALAEVNKEIDDFSKKSPGEEMLDWWNENKKGLIVDGLDAIAESLGKLAEATGSLNAQEASDFMGALSRGVKGFQNGGWIGVLIAGIEETLSAITDLLVSSEAVQTAIENAQIEAWINRIEAILNSEGIFGENPTAKLNASIDVINEIEDRMRQFSKTSQVFADDFNRYLEATNLLSWRNWAMAFTEVNNNVLAYQEALDKGYSKMEAHVFRTNNRSWLANFFGIDDQYDNLKDIVEGLGYELYDEYGNLNKDALQAILDTYTDLTEEDRNWIEEAIAYSEEYAEAMQNIADYIESLFGNVADTIADQFIDSFLESGKAAMDFDKVMSEVARNMVKNLIKSAILDQVMESYTASFKQIMLSGEYDTQEQRQAALLALFAEMGGEIEALQPYIQSLLEAYQGYLGQLGDEESAISGNLLQSASQDSVDLLNGQLNAIRTNQSLMASRVDDVLMQLMGIRNDMNEGFNRSVQKLEEINYNVSDSNGGLLRQLGIWIG